MRALCPFRRPSSTSNSMPSAKITVSTPSQAISSKFRQVRTDTNLVRAGSRAAGGVSEGCAQDPILAQAVCDVLGPAYKGISRLCIQGRDGSGKTWLLRHLGVTLADLQLKGTISEPSILPIRVSLHDLAAYLDNKDPLKSLRESWLEAHCDLLERAHKSEKVLLLLDGLDEVPAVKHDDLLKWLGAVSVSFVVLTMRPDSSISLELEEIGFEVCQLLPPDPKKILRDVEIPATVRHALLIRRRTPRSILIRILRLTDGRRSARTSNAGERCNNLRLRNISPLVVRSFHWPTCATVCANRRR